MKLISKQLEKMKNTVYGKFIQFLSSLVDVLRREWCLLILVILFTIVFGRNIFEWYHFLIFIIILLVGRMKIFNMSIGTYLVIFTIALNAVGLQQQNALAKEQLKQLKCEERLGNAGDTTLNTLDKK